MPLVLNEISLGLRLGLHVCQCVCNGLMGVAEVGHDNKLANFLGFFLRSGLAEDLFQLKVPP